MQPLWQDKAEKNFVFTQMSYNRSFNDEALKGTDKRDTVNAGVAYRHLLDDDKVLVGTNVFFDHNFDCNHNRVSIGADGGDYERRGATLFGGAILREPDGAYA